MKVTLHKTVAIEAELPERCPKCRASFVLSPDEPEAPMPLVEWALLPTSQPCGIEPEGTKESGFAWGDSYQNATEGQVATAYACRECGHEVISADAPAAEAPAGPVDTVEERPCTAPDCTERVRECSACGWITHEAPGQGWEIHAECPERKGAAS